MDWHSRRITAILENALLEDSATRDATTYACIDPQQLATATILAKQDCVLAGLGAGRRASSTCSPQLDGTVARAIPRSRSHPEVFDGVRLHQGQTRGRHPAQRARDSLLRAGDPESSCSG